MKRITVLLAAICILALPAEAQRRNRAAIVEPAPIMTNAIDSMSYALGISLGNQILNDFQHIPGGEYNLDVFLKGFQAAMKNESLLMTPEFAQDFFQNFMLEAYEREVAAMRLEGETFLAENRSKYGVYETPSGLQYMILREGNGQRPSATDVVRVHYEGRLLDGTVFDSSFQRGEPVEFPLNHVIPGWTEGVQLMPVGSKYRFFIPYNLGYGEQGAGGVIPPFAVLIFDVELLQILR